MPKGVSWFLRQFQGRSKNLFGIAISDPWHCNTLGIWKVQLLVLHSGIANLTLDIVIRNVKGKKIGDIAISYLGIRNIEVGLGDTWFMICEFWSLLKPLNTTKHLIFSIFPKLLNPKSLKTPHLSIFSQSLFLSLLFLFTISLFF